MRSTILKPNWQTCAKCEERSASWSEWRRHPWKEPLRFECDELLIFSKRERV